MASGWAEIIGSLVVSFGACFIWLASKILFTSNKYCPSYETITKKQLGIATVCAHNEKKNKFEEITKTERQHSAIK